MNVSVTEDANLTSRLIKRAPDKGLRLKDNTATTLEGAWLTCQGEAAIVLSVCELRPVQGSSQHVQHVEPRPRRSGF